MGGPNEVTQLSEHKQRVVEVADGKVVSQKRNHGLGCPNQTHLMNYAEC